MNPLIPDPVNTKFLEAGKKEDLKKYFDFPENMSAVVLKDGKLVYERYNEKRGFDESFWPWCVSD